MTWAMAACWSADDDGTVHLPFDPATGRLDATHSGIEYRYPLAVRHLAERLQP